MKNNILFIIFLTLVSFCFGQEYNFINYSIEDGLVQSQVRSVCQDDDGYIWVGTLGGVSKFNSVSFKNYAADDGLLNNQIGSIYNDKKGRVWLGTLSGVSIYEQNKFTNIVFKSELSKYSVLSIIEGNDGAVWMATDGGGLVKYVDGSLSYVTLSKSERKNYVRSIVCDDENNLWVATRGGLLVLKPNGSVVDTLPGVNATQVYVDDTKTVWCSTFGDGLIKISKNNVIKYTTDDGLICNHIRSFTFRKNKMMWLVSKIGAAQFDGENFKRFTQVDGLSNNNLKCVIEDRDGNLFMGSDGGGLIKYTDDNFVSYTKKNGLSSNIIMSIIQDDEKDLWLSSYDEGISKLTKTSNITYTVNEGLPNNTVWCSFKSKDGSLWFGTSIGVVHLVDDGFVIYGEKEGLNAKKIYALNQRDNGDIWIGTKKGLSILSLSTDSIFNYSDLDGASRNIRSIYKDTEHFFWFCSSDGLFRYDAVKCVFKRFDESSGLPDKSVMSIVEGRNGNYWVGTGKGLVSYKNDVFKKIDLPGNYATKSINFLSLDKNNGLWIGTNWGLYQIALDGWNKVYPIDIKHYSNFDGLKSLECNQNASFIDDENNLWFGTSLGLMKHVISTSKAKTVLPQLHITDIRLFFEKKDLSKYSKGIDKSGLPKDLILKYNKNHLTFDFIGIYHASPDKLRYRFKLNGFDEDYLPVTTANFVTYSNISAGDYEFQLEASVDGKDWTSPVMFSFTVTPPFWFTWWFYLVMIIIMSSVVWWLIVRKQKIELDKRATQLIMDKSKMLTLEQQALNSSMNRHFIFNALNSIQYYINRQDKKSANKYLSSFAKLVRKNLDSSLVNEVYIDEEIERIVLYLKLEQMRFQDKFSYHINVDDSVGFQTIKIPSMLLQPFIENSIWHGILPSNKPGNIDVNIKKKLNQLIIEIIDDGIGITESLLLKKGKKQYHESKGMDLTKNRIELISKISNKACSVTGPFQLEENNKVLGTQVTIIITLY